MLNNIRMNMKATYQAKWTPNPVNTIKLKFILNQYNTAFLILEVLAYTGVHFTMLLCVDISDKLNKEQN